MIRESSLWGMEQIIAEWDREDRNMIIRLGYPIDELRYLRTTLDTGHRMKTLRSRPKPTGPTKKRAKVKEARKANLKRKRP